MASGDSIERNIEKEVLFQNRYKRTALFTQDGRPFFGLWRPPPVGMDGDEEEFEVPLGMEGQLETISEAILGDRAYWTAIGNANQIDYVREEVKAGDVIKIPKTQNVRAAYEAKRQRGSLPV